MTFYRLIPPEPELLLLPPPPDLDEELVLILTGGVEKLCEVVVRKLFEGFDTEEFLLTGERKILGEE